MVSKNRIIALYLPQYHPIPENDEWWGKGFTEWRNVAKAKPLFKGHYQPKVPADLGFYDLRVPETRIQQAELAKEYGIEGFCYWHYWFGNGKQLIERPFNEVLSSGEPDFPFMLAWANESWKGFFHGVNGRNVLMEQKYPSEQDHIDHFYSVLPAFKDKRYLLQDGKPMFMIYRPLGFPEISGFLSIWRDLAKKEGLPGIHFIAQTYDAGKTEEILSLGFDAVNVVRLFDGLSSRTFEARFKTYIRHKWMGQPKVFPYAEMSKAFVGDKEKAENVYPTIIPNWDHTPRTGKNGIVYDGSTPELFADHLKDVKSVLDKKSSKIVFVKSWNEWAEGNYLEPDLRFGSSYLEKIKEILG